MADDAQVKVTDFGLAKPESESLGSESLGGASISGGAESSQSLTQTGLVMGTPRYMAPEQHLGRELSAAADQYAFCVALWEALVGAPPFAGRGMVADKEQGPPPWPTHSAVPRAIGEALRRGLEVRPSQRWPDMEALLERLTDDPTRRRRRLWALGGAVAVAGVGVTAWQASVAQEQRRRDRVIEQCTEQGQSVTAIWNDDARAAVREGLLATEVSYAAMTAERVMPWLDRQSEAWAEARTEACLDANVRATWDSDTLDRAVWCLDEHRLELASLVEQLSHADEDVVRRAVGAAARLVPVASCRDAAVLASRPSPPPPEERERLAATREQLSRVGTLGEAGKYADALALVRNARESVEALGWAPLLARTRAREASLLDHIGEYAEAEAVARTAFVEAIEASAWGVASVAANQLAATVGNHLGRHQEARTWIELAGAAASHAGDPLGLRRARRDFHRATVELDAGNFTVARTLFEQALATEQEMFGDEHPRLTLILNALANTHYRAGEYVEATDLYVRTLDLLERTYGAGHPQVAVTLQNRAAVELAMGAYPAAQATYEQAQSILESSLGPRHPELAKTLGNLAIVHRAVGNYPQALALNERALSIAEESLGAEHPQIAMWLNNLAIVHRNLGNEDEVVPLFERALEIRERTSGPDHPSVAALLNNLASIDTARGEHASARRRLERALAINEKALGPDHPDLGYSLLGLADVELAQGHYDEAEAHSSRALTIREKGLGADHPKVAISLRNLIRIDLARGRAADAIALAERATGILEKGKASPDQVAESRLLWARALWDAPQGKGRDRPRAWAVSEQALELLRPLETGAQQKAEIERWREERATDPSVRAALRARE